MEAESATWKEYEEFLQKVTVAILPVGSVEEHGPHLPLITDTAIAHEIACRVSKKRNVLILPPVSYGVCRTTNGFPGTITLSFMTAMKTIEEIMEGVIGHGVRKIILLTGHWGKSHVIALREASLTVKRRHPEIKILLIPYPLLIDQEARSMLETKNGEVGHAGEFETSLMLSVRPNLVKMEEATGEEPEFPRFIVETSGRKWMKTGVMGEPQVATKEKGDVLIRRIVDNLANLV